MNSPLVLGSLPYALGVVMFGLGLSLTWADFRRVGQYPKAAVVALVCQVVVLPGVCFGVVWGLGVPGELAVGLVLVAASPGGPTANLFSHLFGGNVALNITLTAVNSVLIVVTLPIWVNLAVGFFLPGGGSLGLQVDKLQQVFLMVLGPVAVGMVVRGVGPRVAAGLKVPVRVLSVVVLVAVIFAVLYGERGNLAGYFVLVGGAALVFNVVSLLVGYGVPRLTGVDHAAATAAGFEIGIHNTALAITVALSPGLLDSAEIAIPGAVYGVIMFFTAAVFGWVITRGQSSASSLSARWAKR
ncbi:bile acid:sodium symporter family protein [Sphaerisporangium aureirubrum]|uniref:Bile acid:sodium symporter family protein n=1 Tax=Sphaerisporangium aureirubrum TaxID=1544736 RepID=A0ABW1NK43_9ACTN